MSTPTAGRYRWAASSAPETGMHLTPRTPLCTKGLGPIMVPLGVPPGEPRGEPPGDLLGAPRKERLGEQPGEQFGRPKRNLCIVVALWRALRVVLHLACGITLAALRFPGWTTVQRTEWIQHWSAVLLRILAIRLHVNGVPAAGAAPLMLVANHISWIDVHVLNAICPARFVAKSDIMRWPLIGRFARDTGNLFIERARRRDILRVNCALAALMRTGAVSAVFPEGTTSEGGAVLPFRPALLQAAINCGARLQAVAVSYQHADRSRCSQAAFTGDTSFVTSLWRVLTQPEIHARLQFLPAVCCCGQQRKILARNARQQIQSALAHLAGCRTEPATAALPIQEDGLQPLVGAAFSRMPNFR